MTIAIAAARVRVPLVTPFSTAAGSVSVRDGWLVQLRDRDGREGVGEAALDPVAGPAELAELEERVRALVGRVAGRPDGFDALLRDPAALDDPDTLDGPGRAARAAFEAALIDGGWLALDADAGAAAAGVAAGRAVAVNATIGATALEATVEAASAAVAAGFGTLKLKVTPAEPLPALVDRVGAVRDTVGAAIRLRLDGNGAWSLAEARARLEALAPLGLEYVEQPVATVAELAELRADSPIPLAADQIVASPSAAREVLEMAAADVLVVKPTRVGGPLVARAIARLASSRGVAVVVSTLLETGIGMAVALRVAAALPAGPAHGLATAELLESDLLATPLVVRRGALEVPVPGAWPRPDDAAIRRLAVANMGASW